jgi:two-component system sensor histidine kinase BarA
MSHQLRSPLSVIKWLLDSLKSENIEKLEAIEEQNEKMIRLVNDLLDINKIEDKRLVLQPVVFSLEDVVRKVIGEHQKHASASNLVLNVYVKDNLPPGVADEARIKSVVAHLVDNAIRYSTEKGEVEIKLEEQKEKGFVKCSVIDRGLGIKKEERKYIFQKFFRSPSVLRYQTEGTGVGLYIAKNIIDLSSGEIGFISKENKGSTFWFALPVAKSNRSH